jgi:hypothetical protein
MKVLANTIQDSNGKLPHSRPRPRAAHGRRGETLPPLVAFLKEGVTYR